MEAVLNAFAARRFDEAAAAARKAIAAGAVEPMLHDVIAYHLRRIGDFEGAAVEFGRAGLLDPDNLKLAQNLGATLLMAGRPELALKAFTRILARTPDDVDARYGLAAALIRLDEETAAHREFERVLTLEPNHADSLAVLAHGAFGDGDGARARSLAERALAIAPDHIEAQLVMAKLDGAARDFASLRNRVEVLLTRPDLSRDVRATATILMGDALDGQGEPAEAFKAYAAGQAEFRDLHAPVFAAEGQPSARAVVETAIARFATAPVADNRVRRRDEPPDAPRAHAVLMGFARSGTTLLEHVLASHPDVVCLEESPTLQDAQQTFIDAEDGFQRLAALDDAAWAQERRGYWARVREFGAEPAGKVFIDKLPLATTKIPVISTLFPEARILFAIRDPRDVVLSCFRRSFKMNPSMYEFVDLERAARFYDATMRAGALYRARCPIAVHEVRYERFVHDFEAEARAVCAFLGVDWSDELRDFAEKAKTRRIKTPSAPQVARGLYTDGVGQWRRYRDELAPALPILQPWVERFGYPDE